MLKTGDTLQLSATDLVGHLNCRHLTDLDLEAASGRLERPHYHDPLLEILAERGALHERSYLDHLAQLGYEITRIGGVGILQPQVDQTLAAMRAGHQIIAQGALRHGAWGGRADILRRIAAPSGLGDWSYEVIDTKLARETKGGTVLQLCLYSDLLAIAQAVTPEYMHVVTPGTGIAAQTFRTAAFAAYYRYVRRRLEMSLERRIDVVSYPDPKEHCEICGWRQSCDARRHRDDHLCLVAGITKIQIAALRRRDIDTMAKLAHIPLPLTWKPDRGAKPSYERCREQARVQVEGREADRPVYETLTPAPLVGLSRLPEPSSGDIFFDLEGDPFVGEGGLEFLFGYVVLPADGAPEYVAEWAFTRDTESRSFQHFVDFVMARWAQYPDMHVYHYAPYEPGALKRLMGRYATREDEIDRILRGGLFVDLYSVVKQSIRASVESYSIKSLEVFYAYERSVQLPEARRALAHMEGCLELNTATDITDAAKRVVAGYNHDDCMSALHLREWLEGVRSRLIGGGADIGRPTARPPEPSQGVDERQQKVAALVLSLTGDIPADAAERTADQQARWILANTLDWHRREQKSVWWEYFRLADLPAEDLLDERDALSGLTFVQAAGGTARAPVHRYRFPPQEAELRGGESLHSSGGTKFGKVESISLENRTIDIKKRQDTAQVHPEAVYAHDIVSTEVVSEALLRIGEHVATNGLSQMGPYQAARDLLLRRPPQISGQPLHADGESTVQAAVRIAPKLAKGVLAIQGPPGAGKTFTAARMICELVKAGKRIGVTGNSHKVIRNLLDEVVRAAGTLGIDVHCIQKVNDKQDDVHRIAFSNSNEAVLTALAGAYQVAGGTAWFWSRVEAFETVDVLFVDEAAQMSLANVLAVSQACQSLLLLGDPQQLEQPSCGSHPEGTDVSALDHLLAGKATVGKEEGLFLEETWRLHPDICAFTSELFYEGRLRSRAGLECQTVKSRGRLNGTGLRYLPVQHEGNQSSSPEEADRICELVNEILNAPSYWINREGLEQTVRLEDILIIAPYNAQVFELQERLPGARIGTVDKFQGQQAAIVIYSMTTSSHADAPRGMEFLYSPNRLNVATSRAMCVCVLIGSPALFEPECRTPRQIQLANAFCRYLETATPL
jgi:predicted RecB family nuclease